MIMKSFAIVALSALTLLAVPAQAQTMSTLLPSLTWPEGDVTTSTKNCPAPQVCPVQE
jgi:hypothetical protein